MTSFLRWLVRPLVRAVVREMKRELATSVNVVIDGRDRHVWSADQ